jgi:hypothetical protein
MLDRRRTLAGIAVLLAGCSTSEGTDQGESGAADSGGEASPATTSTDGDDGEEPVTRTETPTGAGDLDLREANVTAVSVSESDGAYRFDVTLYHDDDGEDGYANWWQVESLDGEQLGRRTLLHAHGTREFTRSDTFELPAVECVVVRGHDQTHGYGGQAMLVTLATGATREVRQGSEPSSFADAKCP